MTTRRALAFTADLDISDVSRGLRRIEMQSRRAGAAVGRVGRGAGGAVGRGAGLGAGVAIFEQAIMKILELFEDTPVLETFTEALDALFKGFGPLIGVLLESLTPVIVALTPAIEPLARAITPLIELMGTGLLVAVQLLVPGIALLAQGLTYVTTTIRDVALSGIQFVVDQLNKLPFVDIQANLDITGSSFDTMAGQIAAAGDESDEAEPKVGKLITAAKMAGDEADAAAPKLSEAAARLLDAKSGAEFARDALGGPAGFNYVITTTGTLSSTAADAMENFRLKQLGARQEADLLSLSLGGVRSGFSNAHPEADTLANRVADMTSAIMDAQTETDLQTDALALLTPELRAAAAALGLFGLEVASVGRAASAAAGGLGGGGRRGDRGPNGALYTQTNPDGSRQSGRAAPGPRFRSDIAQDPISQVYTDAEGNPFAFNTVGGRNDQFNIAEVGRLADALAFLAAQQMTVTETTEDATAATEAGTMAVERQTMADVEATRTTGMMTVATMEGTTASRAATTATIASTAATMAATPQVSALDALLAQMTKTITDTAAATELQEMALAALSPELRALAEELGLFGLRVADTAEMVSEAADGLSGDTAAGRAASRQESRRAAFYRNRADMAFAAAEQARLDAIDARANQQIMVMIDGESVATATTRAQSEGAG